MVFLYLDPIKDHSPSLSEQSLLEGRERLLRISERIGVNAAFDAFDLLPKMTCLVFSSQFHLETLAPLVDLFFHSDMNSTGVL